MGGRILFLLALTIVMAIVVIVRHRRENHEEPWLRVVAIFSCVSIIVIMLGIMIHLFGSMVGWWKFYV